MRTTLNIDHDVLQAAKELARRQGLTDGKIISKLARRGLIGGIGAERTLIRNVVPDFACLGRTHNTRMAAGNYGLGRRLNP
jgi:hypothetical protein